MTIRLSCGFFTHVKTIRLRASIGDDAFWVAPRLWAYAAENQPDGDFSKYSAAEIALAIGYSKDAKALLEALLHAGFMDKGNQLHDWAEHNAYHASYAARAKKAARARWDKEEERNGTPRNTSANSTDSTTDADLKSNHQETIRLWCEHYQQQFGDPYNVSAKDGKAVKEFLAAGMSPQQIVDFGRRALNSLDGFLRTQASDLHGLWAYQNKIRAALSEPTQSRSPKRNPGPNI